MISYAFVLDGSAEQNYYVRAVLSTASPAAAPLRIRFLLAAYTSPPLALPAALALLPSLLALDVDADALHAALARAAADHIVLITATDCSAPPAAVFSLISLAPTPRLQHHMNQLDISPHLLIAPPLQTLHPAHSLHLVALLDSAHNDRVKPAQMNQLPPLPNTLMKTIQALLARCKHRLNTNVVSKDQSAQEVRALKDTMDNYRIQSALEHFHNNSAALTPLQQQLYQLISPVPLSLPPPIVPFPTPIVAAPAPAGKTLPRPAQQIPGIDPSAPGLPPLTEQQQNVQQQQALQAKIQGNPSFVSTGASSPQVTLPALSPAPPPVAPPAPAAPSGPPAAVPIWRGAISWTAPPIAPSPTAPPPARPIVLHVHATPLQPSSLPELASIPFPPAWRILNLVQIRLDILQKFANEKRLPAVGIGAISNAEMLGMGGGGNNEEMYSYFAKQMDARKTCGIVVFPSLSQPEGSGGKKGMVLLSIPGQARLVGILFIKVDLPEIWLGGAQSLGGVQGGQANYQQQQQMLLQQQQQQLHLTGQGGTPQMLQLQQQQQQQLILQQQQQQQMQQMQQQAMQARAGGTTGSLFAMQQQQQDFLALAASKSNAPRATQSQQPQGMYTQPAPTASQSAQAQPYRPPFDGRNYPQQQLLLQQQQQQLLLREQQARQAQLGAQQVQMPLLQQEVVPTQMFSDFSKEDLELLLGTGPVGGGQGY